MAQQPGRRKKGQKPSDPETARKPAPRIEADEPRARIPPSKAKDKETKRYAVAVERLRTVPLTVTAEHGRVARSYAPADLFSGLAEKVQALLRDVGGGVPPMFYGALATNSMTLFFGDPHPEEVQERLAVEVVHSHARRVAELIELEDEALFGAALRLGMSAQRYSELAHFVESEGITLSWTPRDEPPRILTPQRAALQHARLSAEPPHEERDLMINGILYRVIADRQEGRLGTVGIRLHSWSARPPARQGVHRRSVLAAYEDESVEASIKEGLIGEPVEALLSVRQPVLGLSIDPEHVELAVVEIQRGPSEESRLGQRFLDDDFLAE